MNAARFATASAPSICPWSATNRAATSCGRAAVVSASPGRSPTSPAVTIGCRWTSTVSAPAATGDTSSALVVPADAASAATVGEEHAARSLPRAGSAAPPAGPPGCPAPSTHGVGLALPMVIDSRMVALNDSVMWKNSTFTDSEIDTPASKVRWIGW